MERSTKYGSENDIRNFTYDPDGNMTSDGRGIYKYDGLNRMTEAAMEDGRKLICRYDAEGLRHETEENGRLVSSDSENARTYYHYACDSLGSITYVIAGNEFENEETNGDINSRILCRYDYDVFGNTINAEETITNNNPVKYVDPSGHSYKNSDVKSDGYQTSGVIRQTCPRCNGKLKYIGNMSSYRIFCESQCGIVFNIRGI